MENKGETVMEEITLSDIPKIVVKLYNWKAFEKVHNF